MSRCACSANITLISTGNMARLLTVSSGDLHGGVLAGLGFHMKMQMQAVVYTIASTAGNVLHLLMDFLGDSNTAAALDVVFFVREVMETNGALRWAPCCFSLCTAASGQNTFIFLFLACTCLDGSGKASREGCTGLWHVGHVGGDLVVLSEQVDGAGAAAGQLHRHPLQPGVHLRAVDHRRVQQRPARHRGSHQGAPVAHF